VLVVVHTVTRAQPSLDPYLIDERKDREAARLTDLGLFRVV
jgi:hypothetical protein